MTEWVEKLPTKAERRREQNRKYHEKLRILRGTPEPKREKDESGREVLVYDNGLVKSASDGHIIRPPKRGIVSSERGRELNTLRYEKVRAKTRQEVLRLTKETLPDNKIITSDDAFAAGAALTWKKTVLNSKAYARDVIAGLESVGRIGDFLPKPGATIQMPGEGVGLFMGIDAAREFLKVFEYYEVHKDDFDFVADVEACPDPTTEKPVKHQ